MNLRTNYMWFLFLLHWPIFNVLFLEWPTYGEWVVCVTTLTQNCQLCSTSKLWMDLFLCLRPVLLQGDNFNLFFLDLDIFLVSLKSLCSSREEKSLKVVNKAATPAVREPPQFGLRCANVVHIYFASWVFWSVHLWYHSLHLNNFLARYLIFCSAYNWYSQAI